METNPCPPSLKIIGNFWFPENPGGLDRYVYELAQALVKLNTQIDLFGINLPEDLSNNHLRLVCLARNDQNLIQRLWSANHIFRQEKFDKTNVVNLHFALNGLPLLPYISSDLPMVFTFHGPWFLESKQEGDTRISVLIKKSLEAIIYQRCNRFITLSKAFAEVLNREFNVGWDKIHVIPGGVDTNRFQITFTRQQARERLGWPPDRFILFTPRRLVQRMGLAQLLAAIAPLAAQGQDIWLAIAGKGSLRSALESQMVELNLQPYVRFLGFLPDDQLPTAYQAADLTVVPSQSLEGFGLVLLESLACGTPVLCTPVGGMPEVIQEFSPQLITESATATSLQASFERIFRGDIVLPTREQCRAYANTHFSWPEIAHRVQSVLLSTH